MKFDKTKRNTIVTVKLENLKILLNKILKII